jgi:hypothetical protein
MGIALEPLIDLERLVEGSVDRELLSQGLNIRLCLTVITSLDLFGAIPGR